MQDIRSFGKSIRLLTKHLLSNYYVCASLCCMYEVWKQNTQDPCPHVVYLVMGKKVNKIISESYRGRKPSGVIESDRGAGDGQPHQQSWSGRAWRMEAEKEPARWEVGAMQQVHLCGHLKKPVSKGKRGGG